MAIMARVNVDIGLVRNDPRWMILCRNASLPLSAALGSAILVWGACYERRTPVLSAEEVDVVAERAGFATELVRARLAHDTPDGVHLCGVEKRIGYLLAAAVVGATGGRRSGEARRAKSALRGENRNEANPSRTLHEQRSEPLQSVSHKQNRSIPLVPDLVPDLVLAPDLSKNLLLGTMGTSPSPPPLPPRERGVLDAIQADETLRAITKNPATLARDLCRVAPGLDVALEIAKAGAWLRADPKRRKSNGARFLTTWLTRAQDGRREGPATGPPRPAPVVGIDMDAFRAAARKDSTAGGK